MIVLAGGFVAIHLSLVTLSRDAYWFAPAESRAPNEPRSWTFGYVHILAANRLRHSADMSNA